ncbi:MAG: type VI secretion system protein ImpD [Moritella dasanensis]|jgi:type VI secretion system protein ImpD
MMQQTIIKQSETVDIKTSSANDNNTKNQTNRAFVLNAAYILQQDFLEQMDVEDDLSIEELLVWLVDNGMQSQGHFRQELNATLTQLLTDLDKMLNTMMNNILHNHQFQRLEASWRGVHYLVQQEQAIDREELIQVRMLCVSWQEISRDFSRAIEFDQSNLYRLIYSNEFGQAGGQPFGLLLGDYQITNRIQPGNSLSDIDILRNMTQVSAAAFAPFVASASPQFFGVNSFAELGLGVDIDKHFDQVEYTQWRRLRDTEDARYLGLTVPYMLMRRPYVDDGRFHHKFRFRERIENPEKDNLWGNIGYAFAVILMRSFASSKWFAQIRGVNQGEVSRGLVDQYPHHYFGAEASLNMSSDVYKRRNQIPLNMYVSERLEKQFSEAGFIPLSVLQHTDKLAFFSNSSVQKAANHVHNGMQVTTDAKIAQVNARLATMLQYILCVSRFAHAIKVIGREKVGSYLTAPQIQSDIQKWLQGYTAAAGTSSDEVRCKRPLSEARVEVHEVKGKTGHFYSVIHLKPHFQLDQMVSSIRLITELASSDVAV